MAVHQTSNFDTHCQSFWPNAHATMRLMIGISAAAGKGSSVRLRDLCQWDIMPAIDGQDYLLIMLTFMSISFPIPRVN
jgi:hypothetical protein